MVLLSNKKGLVDEANNIIQQNPRLLQAYGDYMDVNHQTVDPILKEKWEHQMMWLLHLKFMELANAFKARSPAYRKEIGELVSIMKLLAQTVDLALLPKEHREIVDLEAQP